MIKQRKKKKFTFHQDNKLLITLNCFEHKIVNLLDKFYEDLFLKNGSKFMIKQEEVTTLTKKLEFKHHCGDQIYIILLMRIFL